MRKLLSALILVLGLAVAPAAAHADSVTYNLLLTPYPGTGNIAGTGSFTITGAPNGAISEFDSLQGNLTAMSFTIGGDPFDLTNASSVGQVLFLNGQLDFLFYNGGTIDKSVNFSLDILGLTYVFDDVRNGKGSIGTISVVSDPPSTSPIPEPSALLLFGTGALGLAGIVSRKLTG